MKSLNTTLTVIAMAVSAGMAQADIVHNDDVISNFSHCIGTDCVNGENFGFDTLRLKENNLRIHFDDTSTSGSFPKNDWRITINSSDNGGGSYFSIDDASAGRQVFRVDAGAPANSLRVDAQGDVGIGASSPVVELHVKDGDSPTLRLEQDGSSGFGAQTWDVVGNEANFFVRDVTNGSQLPLRIEPGADTNTLFLQNDNDVGIGTNNPQQDLHVHDATGTDTQIMLTHNGSGTTNGSDGVNISLFNSDLYITNRENGDARYFVGGEERLTLDNAGSNVIRGNLNVTGDITSDGTTIVPDYVFEDSYQLMPIEALNAFITQHKHLPNVPSATDIARNGLNYNLFQMNLLEKIEELALYTIEQHKLIQTQQERMQELQVRLVALEQGNPSR